MGCLRLRLREAKLICFESLVWDLRNVQSQEGSSCNLCREEIQALLVSQTAQWHLDWSARLLSPPFLNQQHDKSVESISCHSLYPLRSWKVLLSWLSKWRFSGMSQAAPDPLPQICSGVQRSQITGPASALPLMQNKQLPLGTFTGAAGPSRTHLFSVSGNSV